MALSVQENQGKGRSAPCDADRLVWTHWAVLAAGCLAGLVAAALVSSYPFDFSREIAEAKRLGIVSRTILAGYPKSRDLLLYAALILLPLICSLGAWLCWSRGRRPTLASLFRDSAAPASLPAGRPLLSLALLLGCLLLQFNVNNFYEPAGGWAFLGEEGQFLADAQVLLGGGSYARDFFCLYGPLVVYPLAFAMKLFGASILVGRCYTYALTVLSAAILFATLNLILRDRRLLVLASLLMGALFISGGGRTGATMLRVTLGFVPLLILYRDSRGEGKLPPLAAGLALGVSLLFSQEVGLCAGFAAGVFLGFQGYARRSWLWLFREAAWVAVGCALVLLPMLAYFHSQDALGRFFESLYGYPRLVTLGYGSLPFPSLRDLLSAPLNGAFYFPYYMIGVYLFAALYLLLSLLLGLGNRDLHLRGALLVFGMLLFRAALGRSDESHYFFALSPALLLVFLICDDALRRGFDSPVGAIGTGRRLLLAALSLSLLLLLGTSSVLRANLANALGELGRFPGKFSLQQRGVALPQLPRGGIFYDAATAQDLVRIGQALERYTKPGEPVLFYPNEAAYYFLFDRPVPTRYVHAYFAASAALRADMVADLEKSRPAYVIYTLDNWRIDDILEDVQVPEVSRYLKEKYELAEDLGNILVLRRKGS